VTARKRTRKAAASTVEQSERDREAVRAVVAVYEDAVHTANAESFRRAFHPEALLVRPMVPGGPLVTLPLQSYSTNAERLYDGEVPVHETTRQVTVDVAGNVAVARLDFEVRVGDEHYEGTDFLSMAKLGGRWQVTYVLWDSSPSQRPS
jgi:hypothetical protein